ncbi:DUF1275 domain protein [Naematelia encephala]|uniref:DUF1275 domain protein n=1 Tax=Naematelia encephala TaxID=71784 RepID=A0A1Y2AXA5_9TREE|nr:DUF1275 domain protein [Naematelia encephala]
MPQSLVGHPSSPFDEEPQRNNFKRKSWRAYLAQEIDPQWTDLVLLAGCFITGLLDSAVFNVWRCFVSMQTGNSVYVGLGLSSQPATEPYRYMKSGTSILAFIVGSYVFSRLMRFFDPLRRSTLFLASLVQNVFCLVPALLVVFSAVPPDAGDRLPNDFTVLLPLALLSFQAGGQCVLSRVLGYGELPTVVLTSAYCDLAMDEKVFHGFQGNSKRNRRMGSIALLILGAGLGGFMTKERGLGLALWTVTGLKAIITVVWLVWPAEGGHLRLQ